MRLFHFCRLMNSNFRFEITVIFYFGQFHITILCHNFRLNIWKLKRFKDHFYAEVVETHGFNAKKLSVKLHLPLRFRIV
jgi:hypothetical protein